MPEGVVSGHLAAGVNGEEGQLGAVLGPLVDDVETEVEELGDFEPVVGVGVLVIGHVGGTGFDCAYAGRHRSTSNSGPVRSGPSLGSHSTINVAGASVNLGVEAWGAVGAGD